jgi:hypothetical protein
MSVIAIEEVSEGLVIGSGPARRLRQVRKFGRYICIVLWSLFFLISDRDRDLLTDSLPLRRTSDAS